MAAFARVQSGTPYAKGRQMIFAFTNSKGGVGKSTLSVHFTVWLMEQGASVALIDADVQGSSSVWLHEAAPETAIVRLQTPDDILEQVPNLREQFSHVVIDGPAGLSEVTRTILFVADTTFLPCGPSVLDLRAANEAIRVVRQAQSIRKGPPRAVLIPNKLEIGAVYSTSLATQQNFSFDGVLLKMMLRY